VAFQTTFLLLAHSAGGVASGKRPVPSFRQPTGPSAATWLAVQQARSNALAQMVLFTD
jgi:hypothetical protein